MISRIIQTEVNVICRSEAESSCRPHQGLGTTASNNCFFGCKFDRGSIQKPVADTLRNFFFFGGGGEGTSAEGTRLLRGRGARCPGKFSKIGSLKWHLQHSESTFCKKFQVFKTLF